LGEYLSYLLVSYFKTRLTVLTGLNYSQTFQICLHCLWLRNRWRNLWNPVMT